MREDEGRMKNYSFHPRKIRLPETAELDHDQLKRRTIIALNKLGQQKFSTEPGGYSLENWTRGVNLLLDEFEEKVGAGKLSSDYIRERRALNDRLSTPVSTPSIDKSITELRQSMAQAEDRIDAERTRLLSKLAELRSEYDRCSAELAQEQERNSDLAADQSSGSFLKRIFGGNSRTSAKDSGTRIKDLESKLDALSSEMLAQQTIAKSIDQHSPGSPVAKDWSELESLQGRLAALENERSEMVQLVKERKEITASMADAISKLP